MREKKRPDPARCCRHAESCAPQKPSLAPRTRPLCAGGQYAGTADYFFSNSWAGSLQGNAALGYPVEDGLFPYTPVRTFDRNRSVRARIHSRVAVASRRNCSGRCGAQDYYSACRACACRYAQVAGIYWGSQNTGLLRGRWSTNGVPFVTRYPQGDAVIAARSVSVCGLWAWPG